MKTLRTRNMGFTLIEVMIAAGILSSVLGVTLALMSSLTQATASEKRHAILLQDNARAMDRMTSTFSMSRVVEGGLIEGGAGNLGASTIAWQIPVAGGGTGMIVNNALAVRWGVVRAGIPMAGEFGAFRFVPTDTFDESAEGVDLNGDGHMSMVFDVGHIEEVIYNNADLIGDPLFRRRLTLDNVVQIPGDVLADIDGDGIADPLFSMVNASTMRVIVFFFDPDRPARTFRRREAVVALHNHM